MQTCCAANDMYITLQYVLKVCAMFMLNRPATSEQSHKRLRQVTVDRIVENLFQHLQTDPSETLADLV